MSGIYIPGMEMPRHCRECCFEAEGYFCWVVEATRQDTDEWLCTQFYGDTESRPEWCPLIPVPDHGKLIDANKFLDDCPELTAYEQIMETVIPADPAKEGEE